MTLSRFSGSFYVAAYLKARAEISRSRSLRASIVLHLTDPHPVPCPLSLAPYRSNESNTPRQFIFQNTLLSVFSGLFSVFAGVLGMFCNIAKERLHITRWRTGK